MASSASWNPFRLNAVRFQVALPAGVEDTWWLLAR